jgi:hypothetical protein
MCTTCEARKNSPIGSVELTTLDWMFTITAATLGLLDAADECKKGRQDWRDLLDMCGGVRRLLMGVEEMLPPRVYEQACKVEQTAVRIARRRQTEELGRQ